MASVLANTGRAIMTNLISGLGGTAPNYLAIGSGVGTSGATDTALFTEYTTGTWSGYARVNATPTRTTVNVANDTCRWTATWTAPATQTVTNGGNFDATTLGNLYIKGDWTGIPLGVGDSITLTITHQIN